MTHGCAFRVLRLLLVGCCFAAGVPSPAAAQRQATPAVSPAQSGGAQYHVITHLNTRNRLAVPIADRSGAARLATDPRLQARLRAAMEAAGLGGLTGEMLATLSRASNAELREVQVETGATMEWMALQRGGKTIILRQVRWMGEKPFSAFEFLIDDGRAGYAFLLPFACGNLSLRSVGASPKAEAQRLEEERRAEEARKAEAARKAEEARLAEEARKAEAAARQAEEARRAEEARQAEAARTAEEARRAEDARLAEEARRERIDVFMDATVGKERRLRESSSSGGEASAAGVCAPLVGLKGGVDIKLGDTAWRLAPAVGVALNFDEGSNTSLFVEAELNYWMAKGFVGTGFGAWDLTHSDTVAPAWLLHAGAELYRAADGSTLLLVGEGRLFLDELGDAGNNYQAWAGLRYVFR